MARGIGVIAMKVFADGAMYGGPKRYLSRPEDVIHTVGKPGAVPSADLTRYALSLPGVSCAVTGIGHIDRDKPEADQLAANLAAGVSDMPSPEERLRIERNVAERQGLSDSWPSPPRTKGATSTAQHPELSLAYLTELGLRGRPAPQMFNDSALLLILELHPQSVAHAESRAGVVRFRDSSVPRPNMRRPRSRTGSSPQDLTV
jgi:hypothetical protein